MIEETGWQSLNESNDKLISKSTASKILCVSLRTIDRMVVSGELIKVKIRGAVRFRLSDVLRFVGGGQ